VVTLIAESKPRSILVPELFDVAEGIGPASARPLLLGLIFDGPSPVAIVRSTHAANYRTTECVSRETSTAHGALPTFRRHE